MTQIVIKEGFKLNTHAVVNNIIKRLDKNGGDCPCTHPKNDGCIHCPCDSYTKRDLCYCGLYIKK